MTFAKIYSAQNLLLDAFKVDIEIDISNGLHSFSIIGLPDKVVEESKDRVSSSIKHCGCTPPKQKNQKVVVSLAPADKRKNGTNFDVPIALAYLKACGEINFDFKNKLFVGELSLNGNLRRVNGIIPIVEFAKQNGFSEIYLPKENSLEAGLISGIKIYGANNLKEIIDHIDLKNKTKIIPQNKTILKNKISIPKIDFKDIIFQENAKRGLEIAASGGHNIALYGPPGTGKTLLSQAFCYLLPSLNYRQIIETSSIHSFVGINKKLITNPPFRNPHHTASYTSIIGGGNFKPGEITLAHNGVLFLDEFPEFDRRVIESLRQPLEEKFININRASYSARFPANFILLLSMNPCPCGYYNSGIKDCTCTQNLIENYQRKISGPIMDRVDLWIQVSNVKNQDLFSNQNQNETTNIIRERVLNCRKIQQQRNIGQKLNHEMNKNEIEKYCHLDKETSQILELANQKMNLSIRSYLKVLKIARTIADLAGKKEIKKEHLLEALQFRPQI